MTDPFRSEHLIYRGIDLLADEHIFSTIRQDPVAFLQADANLLVPQTQQNSHELMNRFLTTSLMAVVICLPDSHPFRNMTSIGWIRLKSESPELRHHRRSEIGVSLAEPYRNKGYGSEAIRWILDWGFNTAGLHRISIKTFEYNDGARRLYERLGFGREGQTRESLLHKGGWWSEFEFGILEHEWRAMEDERDAQKPVDSPVSTVSSS